MFKPELFKLKQTAETQYFCLSLVKSQWLIKDVVFLVVSPSPAPYLPINPCCSCLLVPMVMLWEKAFVNVTHLLKINWFVNDLSSVHKKLNHEKGMSSVRVLESSSRWSVKELIKMMALSFTHFNNLLKQLYFHDIYVIKGETILRKAIIKAALRHTVPLKELLFWALK